MARVAKGNKIIVEFVHLCPSAAWPPKMAGVVRRNLDFYAEISEATVKNDNKQQKKNSYGKGKVSKNKVNPD